MIGGGNCLIAGGACLIGGGLIAFTILILELQAQFFDERNVEAMEERTHIKEEPKEERHKEPDENDNIIAGFKSEMEKAGW